MKDMVSNFPFHNTMFIYRKLLFLNNRNGNGIKYENKIKRIIWIFFFFKFIRQTSKFKYVYHVIGKKMGKENYLCISINS